MSSVYDDRQQAAQQARGRHTAKFWREYDKDSYRCPDCDRHADDIERLEVHHVDEDPFNGSMSNLVAVCRKCHCRRHDRNVPKSLDDWKEDFVELGDS